MTKLPRMKNKSVVWNKIIKPLVATILLLLLFAVGVYIYSPRIIYKAVGNIGIMVLHATGKDQPYDTKYGVHPFLLSKIELVIAEAKSKGVDLRVVRGYRDLETQRKYYAQGRTAPGGIITNAPPGSSFHNYGWAVDVCEYTNGQPNWNSKRWNEIGEIGKKHGLKWGGDWKRLVDKPHLQLSVNDIVNHAIFPTVSTESNSKINLKRISYSFY